MNEPHDLEDVKRRLTLALAATMLLALVANGPAHAMLAVQARQVKHELDETEKDCQLLAALRDAALAQAETTQNRFAMERAVPLFREALRAYGLPVGKDEPAVAAKRIRERPTAVREAIVAALDEWDDLAGNPAFGIKEPHREWLRGVLEAAESKDAWSRQVRAARAEKDDAKRRAALEKLAASADIAKTPARALTRLAERLTPAPRVALLRRAQAIYPSEFWVNHNLGMAQLMVKPPRWDEAVRFLTAAVALRPDSPGARLNLGFALAGKGEVDEAIASYQKAIELDPKFATAHFNLGNALRVKGRLDKAIACFKKAIALDPKNAQVHYNLACMAALAAAGQGDKAAKRDDKERAHLRRQALDSLRAALALFAKQLETGKRAGRAAVQQALVHWETNTDLAGIRDAAALAKLPADEQKAFTQLWADVAALLKKVREAEIATQSCRLVSGSTVVGHRLRQAH